MIAVAYDLDGNGLYLGCPQALGKGFQVPLAGLGVLRLDEDEVLLILDRCQLLDEHLGCTSSGWMSFKGLSVMSLATKDFDTDQGQELFQDMGRRRISFPSLELCRLQHHPRAEHGCG